MSMSHEDIRARYSAGSYQIAGKLMEARQMRVRAMNFGQHWREEAVINIPYVVELPLKLAIDIINWQLPEYVKDAKEHPDDQNLLEQLLKKNGWNTDGSWLMTEGPDLLRQMLLEEYAHEMISQWFGDGQVSDEGYVLNSCKQVEMAKAMVRISGFCRKADSTSAYQDL